MLLLPAFLTLVWHNRNPDGQIRRHLLRVHVEQMPIHFADEDAAVFVM
jgi:hypothetical protein